MNHSPYGYIPRHRSRWNSTRYYSYHIPYRFLYWDTWIRYRIPTTTWVNGYRYWDNYPYYIYNGYLHRYSDIDTCDYELVDAYSNQVIRTYHNMSCNRGYDQCSVDRSYYNRDYQDYRFFCSEKFYSDESHNYNWNLDEDFYHDVSSDDGYYNSYDDDDNYDYNEPSDNWGDDWDF